MDLFSCMMVSLLSAAIVCAEKYYFIIPKAMLARKMKTFQYFHLIIILSIEMVWEYWIVCLLIVNFGHLSLDVQIAHFYRIFSLLFSVSFVFACCFNCNSPTLIVVFWRLSDCEAHSTIGLLFLLLISRNSKSVCTFRITTNNNRSCFYLHFSAQHVQIYNLLTDFIAYVYGVNADRAVQKKKMQ